MVMGGSEVVGGLASDGRISGRRISGGVYLYPNLFLVFFWFFFFFFGCDLMVDSVVVVG